jgi:hypothetical protein
MRRQLIAVAAFVALMTTMSGQGQPAAPWTLVSHTIATDLRGGYQVLAADLNKDKRADLVVVPISKSGEVYWFEAPSWTRHVLATVPLSIYADAHDIDSDGIPEIALASGWSTNTAVSSGDMSLLTHGADVTAPWTVKPFDKIPTSHRVRWIDAEGTGRKFLINAPLAGAGGNEPDYKDRASIYAYDPRDFKRQLVTDQDEGVIHGLYVVDWDGNGKEALLSASFEGIHVHRFANGKWQRTRLTAGNPEPRPRNGSSDVTVIRSKAGRQLAAIEPWHGNQVVIYSGKGDTWGQRTVIDDTLNDGHTLQSGDLDGDGVDEIVAGYRRAGVNVYWHNGSSWSKVVIEQKTMGASGCTLAHLNGDARLDLACLGSSTLKWYENQATK